MVLQLQYDYLVFDNLETVTYYQRTQEGLAGLVGVTVNTCLRVTTHGMDQQRDGLFSKKTVTWHCWGPELGTVIPSAGDVIKDAQGVSWSVQDVDYTFLTQRYVLETVKQKTNASGGGGGKSGQPIGFGMGLLVTYAS